MQPIELSEITLAQPQPDQRHQHLFATANGLHREGKYSDALKNYVEILRDNKGYPPVWIHAGNVLRDMNNEAAALTMYREAERYLPDNPSVQYNIATALRDGGQFAEAVPYAIKAAQGDVTDRDTTAAAANSLLQLGRFKEGWPYFLKRRLAPGSTPADHQRRWNGETLAEDEGLLLWLEQGVGEEIMFSSVIADVLKRVPLAQVTLACRERLHPLYARAFPGLALCTIDPLPVPVNGYQAALGDLATIFRNSFDDFPGTPYLRADAAKAESFRQKYDDGRMKIGISWMSPRSGTYGPYKDVSLLALEPLLKRNAKFVSLQYGTLFKPALESRGITLDSDVDPRENVDDYAAQIAAMDLVITSSNTCAHLAGALGVPVWVMLPATRGLLWHWFLDREDSPWYGSARLFRRARGETDWGGVIYRVATALDDTIRQRA